MCVPGLGPGRSGGVGIRGRRRTQGRTLPDEEQPGKRDEAASGLQKRVVRFNFDSSRKCAGAWSTLWSLWKS